MMKPGYIKGLTLLGGEPFEPENQGPIVELLPVLPDLGVTDSVM